MSDIKVSLQPTGRKMGRFDVCALVIDGQTVSYPHSLQGARKSAAYWGGPEAVAALPAAVKASGAVLAG